MAVPSYATDLSDIYTDTDNFVTVGGGRVTDTETDDYIQGNNCWSHDPFSSGIEGGAYDATAAPTITSDDCVFVWTKCDVAATLATHAAGGIQVIMGDSATAYDCWYVLGSDDYQYGGWKCIPVDPTISPSTTVGTPATNDHFGVRWNVPSAGAAKGYPMKIDAIRHGRSASVTAGDATTPATWAALGAYDAANARQWGICQPNNAGVEIQGIINWGTATTACYFDDDSGSTIIIIDTEWTSTDFTKIIIDHASTTFNMDGLTIKALGTNNPGQLVFNNASTTSALDNNTFDSIGITTLRAGVTADSNKWKLCDAVTQNGATITSCIFDKPSGTVGLVADNIDLVTGCIFNSDGTGHAVNLGTISANTSVSWDNTESGYASTNGSTGNETILVSVSSGITLTINVATGASTPTYYNTGTGTVTVVAGTVTTEVTVKDSVSKAVVEGVAVTIKAATTGPLPFEDTVTITRSGDTATVAHTGHGFSTGQKVEIEGAVQNEYNRIKTITVTGVDAYTYSVLGSPTTPATGTITSTAIIIDGLTDASGQISDSRTLSSDQDITGKVQKGSTPPVYKPQDIATTIDSSNGLNLSFLLIPD